METLNNLIHSDQPVLVDFYADWCGPCKAMTPVIQQVARETTGRVRVVKVNVDKNVAAAQLYNISGVPTFLLFKKGKVVWRHSGTIDQGSLLRLLNQHAPMRQQA